MQKEWFAEWFNTEYYHILYQDRDEDEANRFISNLISFLNIPKKSKLLDLACGKGRHSKILNSFSYDVLGVDLSENSILEAKKETTATLKFAAVFNLFTSFGYFDYPEENLKVCSSVSEMLNSKGKFVIDFMNAEKVIRNLVLSEEKTIDGITFKLERRFDGKHIFKEIHFSDKGQNFHFTERVQALNLQDFQALLSTNFRILETFGSFDLAPFSAANSDRLIIIAELKS
jgi:SAM-dependent methyltransferase